MTTPHPTAADLRATAAVLLAEWRRELAAWWREAVARRVRDDREYLRFDFAADAIALTRVNTDGEQLLERLPRLDAVELGSIAAGMPRVRALLQRTRDVAVRFPRASVLHLDLDLPAASRATLRQAASFELARLSPIKPDQLYFDVAAASMGAKALVTLRAIKRAEVDEAVALCHASGLRVGAIEFEADPRDADWRAYPVDRFALLRFFWLRRGAVVLAAAVLLLLAAVLFGLYLRGASEDNALFSQLVAMNDQLALVHRMQQDASDLRMQIEFPATQKRAPLLLDILAQVTKALPDGTWLTEFAYKDGTAHIQGYSKSPSDLIGDIDQSPYFANAQFEAPLVGAQDGSERFDMTFDVKSARRP
jgi:general secretion pathway protein L